MLLTPLIATINQFRTQYQLNQLEIEVRYGTFTSNPTRFHPGVTAETFARLQREIGEISKPTILNIHDEIQDSIRRSTTTTSDGKQSVTWINKPQAIFSQDISDYGLRITVTQEIPIAPPTNFKPTYIRDKHRYSYPLAGGAVRLDLTQVDSSNGTTYEVEVELMPRQSLQALSQVTELILLRIQDSLELYSEKDKRDVMAYFNQLLTGDRRGNILNTTAIKNPRNLTMKDLVWGGLIGNRNTGYKASHYVDGDRRIFLVAPNGIWLLGPPDRFNRLTRATFPAMNGTALDGVLVPKEKRSPRAPDTEYLYLISDLLAFQGDADYRQKSHRNRMEAAQLTKNAIQSPDITLATLDFRSFNTPTRFFDVMKTFLDRDEILIYKSDGISFTPETAYYNPQVSYYNKDVPVETVPLDQRVLTRYSDNVIWRFDPDLRPRFAVRRVGNEVELLVSNKGRNTLFTGTPDHPFSGRVAITPLLEQASPNTVVEFQWQDGTFIARRILLDEKYPDLQESVEVIWGQINYPLTVPLMRGSTLKLLNYYFDRIRQGLLSSPLDSEPDIAKNLLLMAAGNGEEIGEWRRYARIVAVTSNPDELRRKVIAEKIENKVRIITPNDNIIAVSNEFLRKADVIAITHQMEEFWRSPEDVNILANIIRQTISPDGQIIFFALDGDAINEMLYPIFTPGFKVVGGIQTDSASFSYSREKNLFSITFTDENPPSERNETPVFIYNLITRLPGYSLTEVHRAETEDFLSLKEKILGRLYYFGLISNITPATPVHEQGYGQGTFTSTPANQQTRPIIPSIVAERTAVVSTPTPIPAPLLEVTPTHQSPHPHPKPQPLPTRQPATKGSVPARGTLPTRGRGAPGRPTPVAIRREKPLLILTVLAPRAEGQAGIGEDRLDKLTVTWTKEEVYRIACIGDGSCFFHAFLKGFYPDYQNNNSYNHRQNITWGFRDELASLITEEDPDNPGQLFYETIASGQWLALAEQQQIMEAPLKDDFGTPIDYSLDGIVRLLLSDRDVGDEVYSVVAEIIGVDVYILRGTNLDLYLQIFTGVDRPAVVIVGNGRHYEVVAVKREGFLQTLFAADDPFLRAIRLLHPTQ